MGGSPRSSAVRGEQQVGQIRTFGMGVVATGGDAELVILERQRKNARRRIRRMQRSFSHAPALAAITRMEHTRYLGAAGREPDVVFALNGETGIAGSESAFVGQRRRHCRRVKR